MRNREETAETERCLCFVVSRSLPVSWILNVPSLLFHGFIFGVVFLHFPCFLSSFCSFLKASKNKKGLQSECNPAYHCSLLIPSETFKFILYINDVLLNVGLLSCVDSFIGVETLYV